MTSSVPAWPHRFEPGPEEGATLLLLHGTGGNEDDLIGLGSALAPGVALLSPRGQVLENGMPRFFRRLAEGVFDEADLVRRTHDLAGFVREACGAYARDPGRIWAVGFSNGANIAASLLLLEPALLAGAVLLRATLPLTPDEVPDLASRSVLLSEGRSDPYVPAERAEALARLLREAGADVTLEWRETGHGLTHEDIASASRWLAPKVR
ncbi:MAG TPA: alpha/beta hydrolase [Gemmatimonadales bacterium]|nr:alpha/beta hydrolase [Gemmatimonadales bacterium]